MFPSKTRASFLEDWNIFDISRGIRLSNGDDLEKMKPGGNGCSIVVGSDPAIS